MAKLVTLQATYRIVTPMFIGNADQTPNDGIRPPSVKGVLRFWWRALNWGRFRGQPGADATPASAPPPPAHQDPTSEQRYRRKFIVSSTEVGEGKIPIR